MGAVTAGYWESMESWTAVFQDLRARGIHAPRLLVADGNPAIWATGRRGPEAGEQRCWNHKILNVLDRLPKREQIEAKELLRAVAHAPDPGQGARAARQAFRKR